MCELIFHAKITRQAHAPDYCTNTEITNRSNEFGSGSAGQSDRVGRLVAYTLILLLRSGDSIKRDFCGYYGGCPAILSDGVARFQCLPGRYLDIDTHVWDIDTSCCACDPTHADVPPPAKRFQYSSIRPSWASIRCLLAIHCPIVSLSFCCEAYISKSRHAVHAIELRQRFTTARRSQFPHTVEGFHERLRDAISLVISKNTHNAVAIKRTCQVPLLRWRYYLCDQTSYYLCNHSNTSSAISSLFLSLWMK